VAEPAVNLARAELHELKPDFSAELSGGKTVKVQFNPETLKVSFANQLVQPSSGGDQRGTPARQFVGAGTTKLALQLWFDVTALPPDQQAVKDVRKLTQEVAYFITPKEDKGGKQPQFVPPAVRFLWGSFQFDGMLDSLEESLEFFSPDGRPLRANVSLALSQQKITAFSFRDLAAAGGGAGGPGGGTPSTPGTKPLTPAPQGSTLQGLAESQGRGGDWQAIASANGIENPRILAPGRLINVNIPTPRT
jgi:Contractile injection system tube protein/LysM domain